MLQEETFEEHVARVEANLVKEWPSFCEKWWFSLWDVTVDGVGFFNDEILANEDELLDSQFENLNLYSKCVELMGRYPKKTAQHRKTLKEATETHPEEVIQFIWESFDKCIPLRGPVDLKQTWIDIAIRYFVNLFNLAGVGEDKGTPALMIELPLTSKMVVVAIHCLLFAEDMFSRQNSAWIYERISSDAESVYVGAASEIYFENLMKDCKKVQLFDKLLVSTPGHDNWLCIVISMFTHNITRNVTWEQRKKAMICSMGLIARHLQTIGNIDIKKHSAQYRWLGHVILPNDTLAKVFDGNNVPSTASKHSFLADIIRDHEAAKWMAKSTIVFVEIHANRDSLLNFGVLEKRIFLFSVLLQELSRKNRSPEEAAEIDTIKHLLAQELKTTWKEVLDALRQLVAKQEQHEIADLIKKWSLLGSMIGVPYLVKPPIGCFNPTCSSFVVQTDSLTPRCSVCLQSQYCGVECQNSDWKAHKPHCKKLRGI